MAPKLLTSVFVKKKLIPYFANSHIDFCYTRTLALSIGFVCVRVRGGVCVFSSVQLYRRKLLFSSSSETGHFCVCLSSLNAGNVVLCQHLQFYN